MMDLESGSNPDDIFSCGSCLIGCGAWFNGSYFHCEFPSFILSQNLNINELAFYDNRSCCENVGKFSERQKVVFNRDNSTSCKVLNTGFSRDSFLQSVERDLLLCSH